MLSNSPVSATLGTKNMDNAKKFYTETLGLSQGEALPGGVMFKCGGETNIFVYEAAGAGSSQTTSAAWMVDDFDSVLNDLRSKGVKFEDYDMPGLKTENGVAVQEGMKAAWFKDPDGNILNIVSAS